MVKQKHPPIHILKNSAVALYLQIYQQIRQEILQGEYSSGVKLPPSRELADACGVSRETVVQAYKLLIAEGFVVSRRGAGTFVADSLLLPSDKTAVSPALPLSNWANRISNSSASVPKESGQTRPLIDFGFGRSYPHIFPYDIWRRLLGRYLSTDDMMLSRYGSVAGFMPLRQAIANYVTNHRGVVCKAEQVVVVNGAQQALDLLARLFVEPNDTVLVESPGYTNAYELFQAHGAHVVPISVDEDGLPVEQLPKNISPKLLFVTPSNQFPRGGALPIERRLKLLDWVQQRNAFVIEDDYDGALRYNGRSLSALQGLDPNGNVIYLGTFSKVLFPALRLAYVVLPEQLVDPFLQAKRIVDRGAPTLTQAAVSDFMLEGHFVRHLRQLRQHYGELREVMVTAVTEKLGHQVHFSPEPAGLHLMLYLNDSINEAQLIKKAAQAGVRVSAGAPFHFIQPAPPAIVLGFSNLSGEEIEQGIHILEALLNNDCS